MAAVGGEAVEEGGVCLGGCQQCAVDLEGREGLYARLFIRIAHAHPAIRDERVCALCRLVGREARADIALPILGGFDEACCDGVFVEAVAVGAGDA